MVQTLILDTKIKKRGDSAAAGNRTHDPTVRCVTAYEALATPTELSPLQSQGLTLKIYIPILQDPAADQCHGGRDRTLLLAGCGPRIARLLPG